MRRRNGDAGAGPVAVANTRVELAAAALLIGQLVTMAGLGLRLRTSCPDIASPAPHSMALALLVGLLAGASLSPDAAIPAGFVLLAIAAALLTQCRPLARLLLADKLASRVAPAPEPPPVPFRPPCEILPRFD